MTGSKRVGVYLTVFILVAVLGGLLALHLVKTGKVKSEVQRLEPDLKHRERSKRVEAACSMSRLLKRWGAGPVKDRKTELLAVLLDGLEAVDVDVQSRAAEGLAAWGLEAGDTLKEALTSPDVQMRIHAAYALTLFPNPDLIMELRTALRDSRVEVRIYAAEALGSIKLNQPDLEMVADIMHRVWKDTVPMAQNAAAEAVFNLGYCTGIPVLVKNLDGKFWARFNAYERLTRIYKKLGRTLPPFYPDGHTQRRLKEVAAIKESVFNDIDLHRRIIADLNSDKNLIYTRTRWTIAYLGKFIIPSLLEALDSEKEYIRIRSAEALADMADPLLQNPATLRENLPELKETALPVLRKALNQKGPGVDIHLLRCFGSFGAAEDAGLLSPSLHSPNPDVRLMAIQSLGRIGGQKALEMLTALEAEGEAAEERDRALKRFQQGAGSK